MNFTYRKATLDDLDRIWDKDIQKSDNSFTWVNWKSQHINYYLDKKSEVFVVLCDNSPIGQVTVIYSADCAPVLNKPLLCNGKDIANLNAFRIEKEFEGQGHISKLVKMAEQSAKEKGITTLTIGSEARHSRNLAIYLHFGYTKFVMSEMDKEEEDQENELILYYSKTL